MRSSAARSFEGGGGRRFWGLGVEGEVTGGALVVHFRHCRPRIGRCKNRPRLPCMAMLTW